LAIKIITSLATKIKGGGALVRLEKLLFNTCLNILESTGL